MAAGWLAGWLTDWLWLTGSGWLALARWLAGWRRDVGWGIGFVSEVRGS